MPGVEIDVLVLDTSALSERGGLSNPDLQKLFKRAKDKKLRLVVPHIAWEEWRTQQVAEGYERVKKARLALKDLQRGKGVLSRFHKIEIELPSDEDIELKSRDMMDEIKREHAIHVLELGADHAERAWRRYFALTVEPPFNADMVREERRKDIPDSWILESCIDLLAQTTNVAALCRDGRLRTAIELAGIRVFQSAAELVAEFDAADAMSVEETGTSELIASDYLEVTLNQAMAPARENDRRILGLIAHFDTIGKEQFLEAIAPLGIPFDAVDNSARRLASVGLIRDTGHHYIVPNRHTAQAAAQYVEADVIALLEID